MPFFIVFNCLRIVLSETYIIVLSVELVQSRGYGRLRMQSEIIFSFPLDFWGFDYEEKSRFQNLTISSVAANCGNHG